MRILPKFCIIALLFSLNYAQNLPKISTSIPPVKFFVDKISGGDFSVNVMVPSGADPHTYEPKPAQMREMSESVAYFSLGTEFDEAWQTRFASSAKGVKFYNISDGVQKQNFADDEHDDGTHDTHNEHGAHAHDGADPHIWLDPLLTAQITQNIATALCEIQKKECAKYELNLANFQDEISAIDTYAKEKFKNLAHAKFLVYHPSFGYFAKRYELEQIAIEAHGAEPKPANLARLMKMIKDENIKTIFSAPGIRVRTLEILSAQAGVKVVEIDFLGYEWSAQMRKLIDEIYESVNQK